MSGTSWLQFAALIAVLLLTAPALGGYLAKIYGDEAKKPGDRVFGPIERVIYQVCRVDPGSEQRWSTYALSVLAFSVMSFLLLYGIARFQGVLPFNPTDKPAVTDHVAFNAAVSFMTNTNWQSYSGEATMSHFTQMTGLAVQNFVSASAGMCVLAALIRGLARKRASTLGNFWVDLARTVLRIMFPLSFVVAILLVSQGVIQNLHGFIVANTLEGAPQLIPGGPVASQVAIKQLGTNGGGFFNVNSAHPFENYTPIGNFVENWAILIIPFALCFAFGKMVHDRRQGWAVLAIMGIIWIGMSVAAMSFEAKGNPRLDALGVTQQTTVDQSGGNLEGKEVRFGVGASGLWAASTTGTSNGSVNLDARQLHTTGRHGPAGAHDARRSQPGRHRRRIERPTGHGDPGGFHRRPHGRPDTGVSRQEDPGHRDEAGDALHPGDAHRPAEFRRRVGADLLRAGVAEQPWAAWSFGDSIRLHVGREQQRVGLCRSDRVYLVI